MHFEITPLLMKLSRKREGSLSKIHFRLPCQSCKFLGNSEIDSLAKHIFRFNYKLYNFTENINNDLLAGFQFSYQSCNFLGNTEIDSPARHIFRLPYQSCNFLAKTGMDSHPGCIFRPFHQSCNLSGNTDMDSHS